MNRKKRILSGMRPTGKLHLGHLVGALNNWVRLQDDYECLFMAADWHALMSEYKDPRRITENTLDNVIDWLSCGIDPAKSTLFVQSRVPEHLDLFLFFSCVTPLGLLERCPTYKEQLRELKTREINTYAFLGYPVLQAADILIYRAEVVPVGEDQLPHLELTREIGKRFNNLYGRVFPDPQAKLTEEPRLLGLDGRKMSKSYGNYIALSDSPETIAEKVKSMFTDPQRIKRNDPGTPEKCNVYAYYRMFAPGQAKEIEAECRKAGIGCTDCKRRLAGILTDFLAPIREKRAEYSAHPETVRSILAEGEKQARHLAAETREKVREVTGL